MQNVANPAARSRLLLKDKNKQVITGFLFTLPAIALIIVFLVLPALLALVYSLLRYNMMRPQAIKFVGFSNYLTILQDPTFLKALLNTMYFTVIVVPVQGGLALLLAVLCNQRVLTSKAARIAFFSPVIMSMTVIAILWTFLLSSTGIFNTLLHSIGIPQQPFLVSDKQAMNSIILLSVWQAAGYQMMIFLAGLQNVEQEQYEAADLDGVNPFQKFWYITLPSIRNVTYFVVLITTIQAFKLFTQPYVMTKGGPNESTQTVILTIFQQGFQYRNVGYSSAMSIIFFLVIFAASMIIQKVGADKNA
ncbi:MAG: sugar ABC transporter permease [Ethanoligenens sp.]